MNRTLQVCIFAPLLMVLIACGDESDRMPETVEGRVVEVCETAISTIERNDELLARYGAFEDKDKATAGDLPRLAFGEPTVRLDRSCVSNPNAEEYFAATGKKGDTLEKISAVVFMDYTGKAATRANYRQNAECTFSQLLFGDIDPSTSLIRIKTVQLGAQVYDGGEIFDDDVSSLYRSLPRGLRPTGITSFYEANGCPH